MFSDFLHFSNLLRVLARRASIIGATSAALFLALSLGCNKGDDGAVSSASSKFEVADETEEPEEEESTAGSDQEDVERAAIERAVTGRNSQNSGDRTLSQISDDSELPERSSKGPRNSDGTQGSAKNAERSSKTRNGSQAATEDDNANRQSQAATGESTDDSEGAVEKPPVISQESLESLTPPEGGSPEVIWAFIEQLDNRRPRGRTDREIVADIQKILAARIQAAGMILENEKAPVKMRRDCTDVTVTSLQALLRMGITDARQHLLAFASVMRNDKDEQIASNGRLLAFTLLLNELLEGRLGEAQPIVVAAEQLLREEPPSNERLLEQLCTAAAIIMEAGFIEEGNQIVQLVDQNFSGTGKPEIDYAVTRLKDEALFMELDMPAKLQDLVERKEGALETVMKLTQQLLARTNPGPNMLDRTLMIGETLERMHENKAAQELYDQIGVAFKDVADKKLAEIVKNQLDNAQRRMALMQQQLTVEGKLADGSDLNWADYKGKLVFISFWSVDNVGYLQDEVPAFEALLNSYRDRGFEIIGINVDSDKRRISQYLKLRPAPWPIVLDGSEGKGAMINKCGINMVPFSMLVDQSGTVIEMHLNSQTLPERLTELLGKPDTSPPDGKDDAEQPGEDETGAIVPANEGTYFVSCGVVEETQDSTRHSDEQQKSEAKENNPYLAPPHLTRAELVEFLTKMEEKPKSIRERAGFDEALLDAVERILKTDEQDDAHQAAYDVKLRTLHRRAILEMEGAEEQLWQCVQSLQNNPPERVAMAVEMLTLEHELLQVDELPVEQVPTLLDKAHAYYTREKLDERHLRMASATVHAINRLNVDQREAHFQRFGKVFGQSSDRKLAAYGRRVAETEAQANPCT